METKKSIYKQPPEKQQNYAIDLVDDDIKVYLDLVQNKRNGSHVNGEEQQIESISKIVYGDKDSDKKDEAQKVSNGSLLGSGPEQEDETISKIHTPEMIRGVQRDPRNDVTLPPYEFKFFKKASGKEQMYLIVNRRFKFRQGKFCKKRFYFACMFPKCTARAIAIGERDDKNPTITRIDTVHRLADGSGDIHVHNMGAILAEECRERMRQMVFADSSKACRQVNVFLLFFLCSVFYHFHF